MLKLGLLILVHSHIWLAYDTWEVLDSSSLTNGILPVIFGQISQTFKFFEDKWSSVWFLRGQEFNQLLLVFGGLKSFCGKLFYLNVESFLLLLFFHFFHTDIFKNGGDDWLIHLWSCNLTGGHGDDSLGDDVVDVNTDVLQHVMGDESVLGEFFEEVNLLCLVWLICKFNLIWLTSCI